jgi:hypothetical protein
LAEFFGGDFRSSIKDTPSMMFVAAELVFAIRAKELLSHSFLQQPNLLSFGARHRIIPVGLVVELIKEKLGNYVRIAQLRLAQTEPTFRDLLHVLERTSRHCND